MRDPLDISFSSSIAYLISPSKELEERGKELFSLTELRQRLQFYNKHICSLCYSYPHEGLSIYGMYDEGHSAGTKFFRKEGKGGSPDFEVFLQERHREIDRLKTLVAQKDTYYEKLKCFIEEKAGQIRFDVLKIETNDFERFMADGGGAVPDHLLNHRYEIHLWPNSAEEIGGYNKYVREYVEQVIYDNEKHHWLIKEEYRGFLALPAMDAIRTQIKRAFNKDAAIKAECSRIEIQYQYAGLSNYIELLYPYEIHDLRKWQSAVFNALVNGYQFDYTRKIMSVQEMNALIHVEQVFLYYKYVHLLATDKVYSSFEELFTDVTQNGILSDLRNKKTLPVDLALFDYLFSGWLQKRRGWEHGDRSTYQLHLTKMEFELFLKEYKAEEQTRAFLVGNTREEANEICHKNYEAREQWFRIRRKATKGDCKQIPGLEEGDLITQNPDFSTTSEAFALLTNYYAPLYMELEKVSFIEKYKAWNEMTVRAEIAEIESFMANADTLRLPEACEAFSKWGKDTDEFIYLRFKCGFYENLEVSNYPAISSIGNKEACVYGRYFLFHDLLKAKLSELSLTPAEQSRISGTDIVVEDESKATIENETPGNGGMTWQTIQNNFDNVDMAKVYQHFKRGLVDKEYLTEAELVRYLKAAFEDKQVPKPLFNFTNSPKKDRIRLVFYKYYTDVAGKLHGKQQKYAALLGDYFLGYKTPTVASNFSKNGY